MRPEGKSGWGRSGEGRIQMRGSWEWKVLKDIDHFICLYPPSTCTFCNSVHVSCPLLLRLPCHLLRPTLPSSTWNMPPLPFPSRCPPLHVAMPSTAARYQPRHPRLKQIHPPPIHFQPIFSPQRLPPQTVTSTPTPTLQSVEPASHSLTAYPLFHRSGGTQSAGSSTAVSQTHLVYRVDVARRARERNLGREEECRALDLN